MSKSPTHTTYSPIYFKSDLTKESTFRTNQQLQFVKIVLEIEQDTGLQQLCTESLMRLNKPLVLETTAATNAVQTKQQKGITCQIS